MVLTILWLLIYVAKMLKFSFLIILFLNMLCLPMSNMVSLPMANSSCYCCLGRDDLFIEEVK